MIRINYTPRMIEKGLPRKIHTKTLFLQRKAREMGYTSFRDMLKSLGVTKFREAIKDAPKLTDA